MIEEGRTFGGNRIVEGHSELIRSSPAIVFPLLCPVQEYKWIHNWECEIIYSSSGGIENNCIFREHKSGPILFDSKVPTYWIASRYDPSNFIIQFILTTENIALTRIDIMVKEIGPGRSSVEWSMTITALNQEANNRINTATQNKAKMYLAVLGKTLKYYCEKGKILHLSKANLMKMGISMGALELIGKHIKRLSF